jgi:hypothetical protein
MRFFLAALALGAVAAPVGCSSLLGDFSLNDSKGDGGEAGPGTDDGGGGADGPGGNSDGPNGSTDSPSDSTMKGADGDAPTQTTDGASEAAPPLKLLHCSTWEMSNDLKILTVPGLDGGSGGGGNGSPINQFLVEHLPGQKAARVLVSTYSSSSSSQAIYTVTENTIGSITGTLTFNNQSVQALDKTSSGMAMIVQNNGSSGYTVYSLPDSDPGMAASGLIAQGSIPALPNQATSGNNRTQMMLTTLSGGGYYALATYTTPASQFDVVSWLTGKTSWDAVTSDQSQQLAFSASILQDPTAAAVVYGFFPPPGMGNGAPGDVDEYTFNTAVPATVTSRSVLPSGTTTTAAAVATALNPGGGYSLAFIELGSAQLADLRLGNVTQANIGSFHIGDLQSVQFNVQSDAGFFDTTPFSGGNGQGARWMATMTGQEFGAMGMGGTGGGGGSYTGLNFYVATSDGQWLVEVAGTGNNLLAGRSTYGSSFDLSQAVQGLLRTYDVAWVEKNSDGTYSLFFNVLDCGL